MNLEIKKQAKTLKPMVRVGKSGINDSLIEEIKKHLKKRKIVKVKFLKNSADRNVKEMAANISTLTSSDVISVIGFTAVFYRNRK